MTRDNADRVKAKKLALLLIFFVFVFFSRLLLLLLPCTLFLDLEEKTVELNDRINVMNRFFSRRCERTTFFFVFVFFLQNQFSFSFFSMFFVSHQNMLNGVFKDIDIQFDFVAVAVVVVELVHESGKNKGEKLK